MNFAPDALPFWVYPLLTAAGFVAGIANTAAGGGSFLTLPALIFAGLPPSLANGTNRLAVTLQTATATAVFARNKKIEWREVRRLALFIVPGAAAGALLAARLDDRILRPVFSALMLGLAVLFIARPKLLLHPEPARCGTPLVQAFVFFGIGLFGGFIQAGVGLLLLAAMALLTGRDLTGANGVKNGIAFLLVLPPLAIFLAHDQVVWAPGLALALGNVTGALAGAKLTIDKGERFIYPMVVVVLVLTSAKLLYDAELFNV